MFSRLSEKSSDARMWVMLDRIFVREESFSVRTMVMMMIVCDVDGRVYVCASCGFVCMHTGFYDPSIVWVPDLIFLHIPVCIMTQ